MSDTSQINQLAWKGRIASRNTIVNHNKRAAKFGCRGRLSRDTLKDTIYRIFPPKCLACGATDHITLDHVIPLSKGGANHWRNLQPLCVKCNVAKGDQVRDYRTGTGKGGAA